MEQTERWEWDEPLHHADLSGADLAMVRLTNFDTSEAVLMVGVGMSYLVDDDEATNGVLRAYVCVSPEHAELIASAPTLKRQRDALLEACKIALDNCCCHAGGWTGELAEQPCGVCDNLRAAIALCNETH
jgi:hypothetical protein